jgi:hypothetical protein
MADETYSAVQLHHPDPPPFSPGCGCVSSGDGPPGDGGNNGDIYVDLSTGDVYRRYGDTWHLFTGSGGVGNKHGVGSPIGSVTPDAQDQLYRRTDVFELYISTGLTNADWQLL